MITPLALLAIAKSTLSLKLQPPRLINAIHGILWRILKDGAEIDEFLSVETRNGNLQPV